MSLSSEIAWLMQWYSDQCDGKWEHSYGIQIETLDNPGWSVEIDLTDTRLSGRSMAELKSGDESKDWLSCRVENDRFLGYGGVMMLAQIIARFRWFAEGE